MGMYGDYVLRYLEKGVCMGNNIGHVPHMEGASDLHLHFGPRPD